jgi:hypothetical protein
MQSARELVCEGSAEAAALLTLAGVRDNLLRFWCFGVCAAPSHRLRARSHALS